MIVLRLRATYIDGRICHREMSLDTPCIDICHLNALTGHCEGCGRTGAEIANWLNLTPSQRRAIMAVLPQRLAQTQSKAS